MVWRAGVRRSWICRGCVVSGTGSEVFPEFFLVAGVDEAEGEEDEADGDEADDAGDGFEGPDVDGEDAGEGGGEDEEAGEAVDAFTEEPSRAEGEESEGGPAG